MPESTRPPPPKTGSGGFIAAAAVMLLLMGGLIYWKVSGDRDPPSPVVTTPPVLTETAPRLEAPPPPPPKLEEVEDAGKKVVKQVRSTPSGGGCAGECTGTAPAALQGALRAKAGAARGCYERALRQNAMLQGKLMVAVRVGPQGQICSANVVNDSLGDPGVASCVLGMIRSSSVPPPNGGCVDVQVPMNFVPKTGT
jgi:outer membrane biosynthesis protein TonB